MNSGQLRKPSIRTWSIDFPITQSPKNPIQWECFSGLYLTNETGRLKSRENNQNRWCRAFLQHTIFKLIPIEVILESKFIFLHEIKFVVRGFRTRPKNLYYCHVGGFRRHIHFLRFLRKLDREIKIYLNQKKVS